MSVQKTISVGDRRQLVDLNGNITNFDLTFTATSKNGEIFEILVVDQTTLDNNPTPQLMKAEKGTMSGNIISDKNTYQNYFLCLRSDKPCEVTVTINLKEIPPSQVPQMQSLNPSVMQPRKSETNWKAIFIVILVIGVAGFIYMKYINPINKKDKSASSKFTVTSQPVNTQPVVPNSDFVPIIDTVVTPEVITPSIVPTNNPSSFTQFSKKTQSSLASRLNNLPFS